MQAAGLDALIVCAINTLDSRARSSTTSGFEIVHRYVYVVIPLEGEPTLVFRAKLAGRRQKEALGERSSLARRSRQWLRDRAGRTQMETHRHFWDNFIMAVRDYGNSRKARSSSCLDQEFDMARAVKSEEELVEVRDAMDIVVDASGRCLPAIDQARPKPKIMAPAVERFFARGAGPRMMTFLLSGEHGEANALLQKCPVIAKLLATIFFTRSKSPEPALLGRVLPRPDSRQAQSDHAEDGRRLSHAMESARS